MMKDCNEFCRIFYVRIESLIPLTLLPNGTRESCCRKEIKLMWFHGSSVVCILYLMRKWKEVKRLFVLSLEEFRIPFCAVNRYAITWCWLIHIEFSLQINRNWTTSTWMFWDLWPPTNWPKLSHNSRVNGISVIRSVIWIFKQTNEFSYEQCWKDFFQYHYYIRCSMSKLIALRKHQIDEVSEECM